MPLVRLAFPRARACYSANTYAKKAKKAVKSGRARPSPESTCMSSSEGDEACGGDLGAVGALPEDQRCPSSS